MKMNPNLDPDVRMVLTYRKYLFMYGIVSILLVLKRFELEENYEQCSFIIRAIREQECRLDIKFHTELNEQCIAEVLQVYKSHGQTGVNLLENSEYYAEIIYKEILDGA